MSACQLIAASRRDRIYHYLMPGLAISALSQVPASAQLAPAPPAPPRAFEPARQGADAWNDLIGRAEAALRSGDTQGAASLAHQALVIAERDFGPESRNVLRSALNLAIAYFRTGRFSEAAPYFRRSLELGERIFGADDRTTLALVVNLAQAEKALHHFAEAETLYQRALAGQERNEGRDGPATLSTAFALASLYGEQGRNSKATSLLDRVVAGRIRTLGPDHQATLDAEYMRSYYLILQGRYVDAEADLVRGLERSERNFGPEAPTTIAMVTGLALLYYYEGRYSEAEPLYLRGLEAQERTRGRDNPATLATVNNLGGLYQIQRRYREAETLYRRSLEAHERLSGRDHPSTFNALLNLAELYQSEGRYPEAEPLLLRALEGNERVRGANSQATLITVNELGELYQSQMRGVEAERLFVRAFEGRRRLLGRDHPETIESARNLARSRLQLSRGDAGLAPARDAISGLRLRHDQASASVSEQAQSGRELAQASETYLLFADAAWSAMQGRRVAPLVLNEAFVALQEATTGRASQAVIQMGIRHLADEQSAGLGQLVRERENLTEQWSVNSASYSAALSIGGPEGDELKQSLRTERAAIEARILALDTGLRREFPQYFALIRPGALDLAATQAMLAPDEAILMVVPTEFGTHVLAISRSTVEWRRSQWTREQINAAVRRLLWDVGASVGITSAQRDEWESRLGPGYSYDRTTAYRLYQQIVAPVAGPLAGKRHVFIAAGGSLTSLPFGMLVTAPPQGADGDPAVLRDPQLTRWFADAHALVQIPSIQSLQFQRRFRRSTASTGGRAFVGFGDPILLGRPAARARARGEEGASIQSLSTSSLRLMSRLPGTAIELESIRAALGAPREAVFLGERATETNVRTADLTHTRIVAFATHGLLGGQVSDVAEPGLVLTPPTSRSEADNGFLTTSEIAALRLSADWVILSACNTAAGDGSEGAPGLSGLARAFFYAGARNLLASHWPVGDDVAARLTVRTVQLLNERPGLSRAEALQLAMREVRNDASHDSVEDSWAHPSAWAPFTLIGDATR